MKYTILILALIVSGCAMSTQKFVDISYNEDGTLLRHVSGHSRSIAPPGGGRAISDHTLEMNESLDGWVIHMGSGSQLLGGELTPDMANFLKAIATL